MEAANIINKYSDKLPVDVEAICKELGISIQRDDFKKINKKFNKHVSGVIYIKDNSKIIFINRDDSPQRQRFTIAHELGHYMLHRNNERLLTDGVMISFRAFKNALEYEADDYAAKLLMPEKHVRDYYDNMYINYFLK
jgi:Zn-dependent peptidase ImmA (M78 family)